MRSWSRRRLAEQDRVGEVRVADDAEQGLRQVVVDVGVDAEEHLPQGRQRRGSVEGEAPGPGRPMPRVAREVGLERVEVEVGEDDVPGLHPARVLERGGLEGIGDRPRRALVGGEEGAPRRQLLGIAERVAVIRVRTSSMVRPPTASVIAFSSRTPSLAPILERESHGVSRIRTSSRWALLVEEAG